jgi:DNA topoisomerase I
MKTASPSPQRSSARRHLLKRDRGGTETVRPGIYRKRIKSGFRYVNETGRPVTDPKILGRIKALVIPPAWTRLWIAPDEKSDLQCTGYDARGRKQYRYHMTWREQRDKKKYQQLLKFGKAFPQIRQHVVRDLRKRGLPREKVMATVLALLERTLIRIGNEEYAHQNGSYGLTTLRDQHVAIEKCRLSFSFDGKGGKSHFISLHNCMLAAIVKNCRAVPGKMLFQYEDAQGKPRTVTSTDVNRYLKQVSGSNFTAKDYRTWGGTIHCLRELAELGMPRSKTEAKRGFVAAVRKVAERLGNTPAICRKCYIHPAVFEDYLMNSRPLLRAFRTLQAGGPGEAAAEKSLIAYLQAVGRQQS